MLRFAISSDDDGGVPLLAVSDESDEGAGLGAGLDEVETYEWARCSKSREAMVTRHVVKGKP